MTPRDNKNSAAAATSPSATSPKSTSAAGRPKFLNEVRKAEIAAMISVGCSRETACRYVGCVPETLRNELRRDPDFREQVIRAERRRQLLPLQQIQQAGKRSWRAAAWLLERVNPKEFARRDPDVVTRDELEKYVRQVIDTICEEVTPQQRERISARVNADRITDLREQIQQLIGEDPALAADPLLQLGTRDEEDELCDGNRLADP